MGKLVQDIDEAAEKIAKALKSSNYRANFSPASLWEIDLFFDDHSAGGSPKPDGLLGKELGARLFALGGYVGETIRRNLGGEWQADDADPKGEINIALKLPDGSLIWPVQRVMKRLKNGAEDGIAGYGAALGLAVGERPTPFSPFRGQGTAVAASPVSFPLVVEEHARKQREQTSRRNNLFGGILLFLGSGLAFGIMTLLISTAWDKRVYLPPGIFLIIMGALFTGGTKLCESWSRTAGRIWLCLCPLALVNAWYFHHLQGNPLFQARASRLLYLSAMCKAELVMAGVSVAFGAIFLVHAAVTKDS